jgi:hypothetical protein
VRVGSELPHKAPLDRCRTSEDAPLTQGIERIGNADPACLALLFLDTQAQASRNLKIELVVRPGSSKKRKFTHLLSKRFTEAQRTSASIGK